MSTTACVTWTEGGIQRFAYVTVVKPSRSRKQLSVYFIRNQTNRCIKIGVSDDPDRRLSNLQTANSDLLELLGFITCSRADDADYLEGLLHAYFGKHRVRGEWFTGHILTEVHGLLDDLNRLVIIEMQLAWDKETVDAIVN